MARKVAKPSKVVYAESFGTVQDCEVHRRAKDTSCRPFIAPNPGVIVVQTASTAGRDRSSIDGGDGGASSYDTYNHGTGSTVDRNAAMVETYSAERLLFPCAALGNSTDRDLDLSVGSEECRIEDPVFHHDVRRILIL